jgi:hypothetical protein
MKFLIMQFSPSLVSLQPCQVNIFPLAPYSYVTFRNVLAFYGESLALSPSPRAKNVKYIRSYFTYVEAFSIRNVTPW